MYNMDMKKKIRLNGCVWNKHTATPASDMENPNRDTKQFDVIVITVTSSHAQIRIRNTARSFNSESTIGLSNTTDESDGKDHEYYPAKLFMLIIWVSGRPE